MRFAGPPASQLISQARRRARMTQAELARRAGVDRSALSQYETGRREPGANVLLALLAAARTGIAMHSFTAEETRRGEILSDLLKLAEELPHGRPRGALRFPSRVWRST